MLVSVEMDSGPEMLVSVEMDSGPDDEQIAREAAYIYVYGEMPSTNATAIVEQMTEIPRIRYCDDKGINRDRKQDTR